MAFIINNFLFFRSWPKTTTTATATTTTTTTASPKKQSINYKKEIKKIQ
jgi:hypothetical protein